ncbi:hypothetical protein EIN_504840 [Entamoeba invadens IP1]|uniref:Uncharacterized protein n=1 Tax=Entamoeba invadens IP1 TaxID=370355 RepID=A0A0A1UDA3_ENTIV|nr:hypothetical protein EIN_504840 [Entamoeba invadens IP1]ELP90298.1 hypothetical protein EIN_504840 [Entamoeba invadens IP1]|eukprot:XP_004257069.1 hypothetical protein EIN_504840 [Entamoeba invadens IP1]
MTFPNRNATALKNKALEEEKKDLRNKYNSRAPMQYSPDDNVQIRSEIKMLNELYNNSMNIEIVPRQHVRIINKNDDKKEMTVLVIRPDRYKNLSVSLYVHDEMEPIPYMTWKVPDGERMVCCKIPKLNGFFDLRLMADKTLIAEEKNVVFGEVKSTQWIEVDRAHTDEEDKTKIREGVLLSFKERAQQGDKVCFYMKNATLNTQAIKSVVLVKDTTMRFVDLNAKGELCLKYFRVESVSGKTPYLHIQNFLIGKEDSPSISKVCPVREEVGGLEVPPSDK